jgi:hypothetical protein
MMSIGRDTEVDVSYYVLIERSFLHCRFVLAPGLDYSLRHLKFFRLLYLHYNFGSNN